MLTPQVVQRAESGRLAHLSRSQSDRGRLAMNAAQSMNVRLRATCEIPTPELGGTAKPQADLLRMNSKDAGLGRQWSTYCISKQKFWLPCGPQPAGRGRRVRQTPARCLAPPVSPASPASGYGREGCPEPRPVEPASARSTAQGLPCGEEKGRISVRGAAGG
jgi:hypothetical protein